LGHGLEQVGLVAGLVRGLVRVLVWLVHTLVHSLWTALGQERGQPGGGVVVPPLLALGVPAGPRVLGGPLGQEGGTTGGVTGRAGLALHPVVAGGVVLELLDVVLVLVRLVRVRLVLGVGLVHLGRVPVRVRRGLVLLLL